MLHSTTRFTTAAVVALALSVPAGAGAQDLRSPDARDAGRPAVSSPATDLRSPDARDGVPRAGTDLRSPDVRFGQPDGTPAPVRVRIVEVPAQGFEWVDAVIGAAGAVALIGLAFGAATLTTHRQRSRELKPAS